MISLVRLALLGVALLVAGTAHAVPIRDDYDIDADGTTVGYFHFEVTSAGRFVLRANGRAPGVDPELFLLHDDGDLSRDDLIARNDDIDFRGGDLDSRIVTHLDLGRYVAATGTYNLTLREVIRGFNRNATSGGPIRVAVNGRRGASAVQHASAVPEPGALALLGAGLVAGVVVRRRRRSAR